MATRARASVVSSSSSSSSKKSRCDKKESAKEDEANDPSMPQLAWKVLSASAVEKLMTLNPSELSNKMADLLNLRNYEFDLKESAQVDFYVAAIWFAREHELTTEQCSAFFTILHSLVGNIKDKRMSITDNIKELKTMMKGVGVSRRTALRCFTVEVASKVLHYIAESLLQHYHLYEFLLNEDQEEQDGIQEEIHLCLPPMAESLSPAPLEEAVTDEFYTQYIAPPPPPVSTTISASTDSAIEQPITDEDRMEQQVMEGLPTPLLSTIGHDEILTVMNKLANNAVANYKARIDKTLQVRETDYSTRLEKIAKTVK